jgi:hypothetical protein
MSGLPRDLTLQPLDRHRPQRRHVVGRFRRFSSLIERMFG